MAKNKGNFLGGAYEKFNVSKMSKFTFVIPFAIIIIAVILIVSLGATTGDYSGAVGIGIDFEGGTILNVTLGKDALTEKYDEHVNRIENAIEQNGVTVSYIQRQEANSDSLWSVSFRYKNSCKDDAAINEQNEAIKASVERLYNGSEYPNFRINYESIGATAAQDLLSKAAIAVAVSSVLILIYIIFRFTLVSGFAAIIALLHDVVIMFALTVICRVQINTYFVAAMITIIAYSINNTIIIFDRCREYVKPLKGQKNIDYKTIGDTAVKENMRRSIFTTITTMVTIIFLAALGSDSIREFCVPIILGLLAGLFSSVFLATPMWSSMSYAYDRMKEKYSKRHSVSYEHLSDEDEEELASVSEKSSDDDDEIPGFTEKKPKEVKPKANQPKGKPIHKYSKKNTTFKKK